jgi:ribonuclease BN (tRNA processing enzyme)
VGLSLTILGSCGSYPGPGRASSGYLVQGASTTVWVDAGLGTMANLQRHVRLEDIDAIVISHEHPDHWGDLMGYHVAAKYYLARAHVPVYSPASLRKHAYYDGPPFEWNDITNGDTVAIGGLTFTFSQTDHGPETLAMRIDGDGRSFAYSADTGPGWSFDRLGPGINLGLCEATYLSGDEGRARHISARQAGKMARDAGVERLVLTHMEPGTDLHRTRTDGSTAFGAPVDIAIENERFDI